jgi:ABC-type lipoprotein release transport system permease subunit
MVYAGRTLATGALPDLHFDNAVPLAIGGCVIALVSLSAACVPVRRAVRTDPIEALRHE